MSPPAQPPADAQPGVLLRAYADEYIPAILAGSADWQALGQTGSPYWRPRSEAEIRRKIQSQAGPGLAPEYNFVIERDARLVGECSIHSVDYRNRVGQVGICIWQLADRRRGHAMAAARELLAWATGYLGLHRLEAWIVSDNAASLQLFEQLGFQVEGTLRQRYLAGGEWHDMVVCGYIVPEASILAG